MINTTIFIYLFLTEEHVHIIDTHVSLHTDRAKFPHSVMIHLWMGPV